MKTSAVLILLSICFVLRFDCCESRLPHEDEQLLTEEEKQIFANCEHSDYRTYLRCLQRHKRQNQNSFTHCVEKCGTNCSSETTWTSCLHCFLKCSNSKFTMHEHYIGRILESDSSSCNRSQCDNANVTTTVNVNNTFALNLTEILDKIANQPHVEVINNINTNSDGDSSGPKYSPSAMPFSFSMNFAGFGAFPMIPMFPSFPPMNPPANVSCTLCGSLFFQYRCDISCINQEPKTTSDLTTTSKPKTKYDNISGQGYVY